MKERHKVIPAVYLYLEKDGKFPLLRRCNTGYEDGNYQQPSGHVEKGESPIEAMVREAREEVGVEVSPEDLEFVHVSYFFDTDGDNYVDFFFRATKWRGEVENKEPKKCDDLVWASPDNLPENTVQHVREVTEYIQKGITFSEFREPTDTTENAVG